MKSVIDDVPQVDVVQSSVFQGSALISSYAESEGVLGASGLRISHVTYVKRYIHRQIRGVGEVQLQYRYQRTGSIDCLGYELFSGEIGNSKGSLIFELTGFIEANTNLVSVTQYLTPGCGSDEFHAFSGEGSYIIAKEGNCSFEITLSA